MLSTSNYAMQRPAASPKIDDVNCQDKYAPCAIMIISLPYMMPSGKVQLSHNPVIVSKRHNILQHMQLTSACLWNKV